MPAPDPALLVLVVPLVLLVTAVWVLQDARARDRADDPVVATVLGLTIDRPAVWAATCVVLFVLAVPLYLVARQHHA